jgi:FtsH-binding integral membrane protein
MNNTDVTISLPPAEIEEIQRSFITRVYAWMTMGLVITAGASLFTLYTESILMTIVSNRWVFFGLIIAELGLVIFLTAAINRLTPVLAGLAFFGYAGLNGLTLSILFLVYTSASIIETFFICACMFGIMSLFGYTTKRDLTSWGSLLFMGLIGLILGMAFNLFFQSPAVYWITTILGILIFVGLIAYDTQKLKNMSLSLGGEEEVAQRASILGALALYLDFINLFLLLLRIFGRRK